MSAEQENPFGMNGLGNCFKCGKGTKKDLAMAFKYYKLSADLGNETA